MPHACLLPLEGGEQEMSSCYVFWNLCVCTGLCSPTHQSCCSFAIESLLNLLLPALLFPANQIRLWVCEHDVGLLRLFPIETQLFQSGSDCQSKRDDLKPWHEYDRAHTGLLNAVYASERQMKAVRMPAVTFHLVLPTKAMTFAV